MKPSDAAMPMSGRYREADLVDVRAVQGLDDQLQPNETEDHRQAVAELHQAVQQPADDEVELSAAPSARRRSR